MPNRPCYRANQKLNLLNSITRHDILNQLTVLGGYIEMSRELTKDKEMLGFIEHEKKATKAIRNMIKFTKDYQDIGLYRPQWQYLKNIVSLLANTVDFGECDPEKRARAARDLCRPPVRESGVYPP